MMKSGKVNVGIVGLGFVDEFIPGAEMPAVSGCSKVDYAVLFVVGAEKG